MLSAGRDQRVLAWRFPLGEGMPELACTFFHGHSVGARALKSSSVTVFMHHL